jgi:predicted aspartyl protease
VIAGMVNPDREAIICLPVRGPDEREQEIEAVIDTGFNGFLTLPSEVVIRSASPLSVVDGPFWQTVVRICSMSTRRR